MWDTSSFVVGIFVGLLLLTLIFWIAYMNRVFIFTTTPYNYPECRSSDYFNNPSFAINDGYTVDEILSIDAEGQMDYRRVPKDLCVPGPNQQVHIKHPQFCEFKGFKDGEEFTFEGRNTFFESFFYVSTEKIDGKIIDVVTGQDCQPTTNTGENIIVTEGTPILKWY